MYFLYRILIFTIFISLQAQRAFTQNASPAAQGVDFFTDLPINDPAINSVLSPGENAGEKIRENIRASAILNKSTCYVGEPILLQIELLTALSSTSSVQSLPSLPGMQVTDMEADNSHPRTRDVNGKIFNVFTVKKTQLIPVKDGRLEIGAITIDNVVHYTSNKKDLRYRGIILSEPITIRVLPIPESGSPANFQGALGKFNLFASVAKNTIAAGENNMLEIELSGTGNFSSLGLPAISWPENFDAFEAMEKTSIDENAFPAKGKKIFSIPFIITAEGKYVLPRIVLHYFDPSIHKFSSSESAAISLIVTPALRLTKTQTDGNPLNKKRRLPEGFWWYLSGAVVLLALGIVVSLQVKKGVSARRMRANAADASSHAQQEKYLQLKEQRQKLPTLESSGEFTGALKKLMLDYLHAKMDAAITGTGTQVEKLSESDPVVGREYSNLVNECELVLYGNLSLSTEVREKMLQRFDDLKERMDQMSI